MLFSTDPFKNKSVLHNLILSQLSAWNVRVGNKRLKRAQRSSMEIQRKSNVELETIKKRDTYGATTSK